MRARPEASGPGLVVALAAERAARLMANELDLKHISDPRKRAYLYALVLTSGHGGRAAEAAGVSRVTAYRWRVGRPERRQEPDPEYVETLEAVLELAADALEDEARRRAIEGLRSYKFDKDGRPLKHPELCECGCSRAQHPKGRPCARPGCDCAGFEGAPYYEHAFSDRLLQFLLRGALPEKYGDKLHLSSGLKNINWDALPDAIIARLAQGEHPYSVFASAAAEGVRALGAGSVEVGGPGTVNAATDATAWRGEAEEL